MHKIEKTDYGMKMMFNGKMDIKEMKSWTIESGKKMKSITGDYSILVDLSQAVSITVETINLIEKEMTKYRQKGMKRSVIIVPDSELIMKLRSKATDSSIGDYQKYIDSSSLTNWEIIGMDWLIKAEDPDLKLTAQPVTK